jgi:hypothetical protein
MALAPFVVMVLESLTIRFGAQLHRPCFQLTAAALVCANVFADECHHEIVAFFRWRSTRQSLRLLMTCRFWHPTVPWTTHSRFTGTTIHTIASIAATCHCSPGFSLRWPSHGWRGGHEEQARCARGLKRVNSLHPRHSCPDGFSWGVWGSETYPARFAHTALGRFESMPEAQSLLRQSRRGKLSRSSGDRGRITEPQGHHVQPTIIAICGVIACFMSCTAKITVLPSRTGSCTWH